MGRIELSDLPIEAGARLGGPPGADGYGRADSGSAMLKWRGARSAAHRLRIRTLGDFEVFLDGKALPVYSRTHRKPLEVLRGLVALGPEAVGFGTLTSHLWPQSEADAAHNACHVALHRLRKILGDTGAVSVSDGKIRLVGESIWIDANEFRRFVQYIDRHRLSYSVDELLVKDIAAELLSLYPGHFLPQEEGPWAIGMREQLRSRFVRVARALTIALHEAGALDAAADLSRRGIELDPLVESFYGGLMRALAAKGRIAEALDTFRRCREIMSVTLGIVPSADTRDLYTRCCAPDCQPLWMARSVNDVEERRAALFLFR